MSDNKSLGILFKYFIINSLSTRLLDRFNLLYWFSKIIYLSIGIFAIFFIFIFYISNIYLNYCYCSFLILYLCFNLFNEFSKCFTFLTLCNNWFSTYLLMVFKSILLSGGCLNDLNIDSSSLSLKLSYWSLLNKLSVLLYFFNF